MSTPIIVLNLDRSLKRKKIMINQFLNSEIENYYFLPAFDGRYMTNLTLNANIGMGYGAGRQFQKAELGIIMGHLAAWKFARMMGFENVIILEDDVAICEDWNIRLDFLFEYIPDKWEYLYLSGHSDYVKFSLNEKPVINIAPKMIGAFSYMINGKALQKLENYCLSFMTTLDDMIMHMIASNKLNGYVYFPFMTYHDAGESLIWGETAKEHSSKLYFKNRI